MKGGLGKEFLKAFAISGARSLAVIDRDLPIAVQACDEIREAVKRELGVPEDEISEVNAWGCDVTNTDEVRRTVEDIGAKFGGSIDILVAAAGMTSEARRLITGICENIPVLEYPIYNFKRVRSCIQRLINERCLILMFSVYSRLHKQ